MKDQAVEIGIKRACDESADTLECSCLQKHEQHCSKRVCADRLHVNQDGQSCLHLLCQDRFCSVDEVVDMVSEHPEATKHRDVYGRTPLFYALKRACSFDVVKTLFDHFPDALIQKDFCGDIPLYMLYHPSKDPIFLQYIFEHFPSFALFKDNTFSGQQLVHRICAPWASDHVNFKLEDLESNILLKDRWSKLVLTVQAAHAHRHKQLNPTKLPELHVALEFLCPPSIICHFVRIHPEQAGIFMTGKERYPLHFLLTEYKLERTSKPAIHALIDAYPEALDHRFDGQLPLHMALTPGMEWTIGLRKMVYSAPHNLESPHPETGLIPILHAASVDDFDLSTLFSMLKEHPTAIHNAG